MHGDFVECVFHTTDSPESKSSCIFHSKSFTVLILEHSCARNQQTHFSPCCCGLKSISTDLDLIKFAIYVQSMLWKQFQRIYFSDTVSFTKDTWWTPLTLNHLGFSVIMYCICFECWDGHVFSSVLGMWPWLSSDPLSPVTIHSIDQLYVACRNSILVCAHTIDDSIML